MELVFRGHGYDTEVPSDMRALQTVLDRIDIEERVKAKKASALTKSPLQKTFDKFGVKGAKPYVGTD